MDHIGFINCSRIQAYPTGNNGSLKVLRQKVTVQNTVSSMRDTQGTDLRQPTLAGGLVQTETAGLGRKVRSIGRGGIETMADFQVGQLCRSTAMWIICF